MPSLNNTKNSLQTKVIKQLEYYFSDINLRNDYFIKKLLQKDSGWLSVESLMKFNRLKSLVNNDINLLIHVLTTMRSDLIEYHSKSDKIRRRDDKPVPKMDDNVKRSLEERTVEVKGFPKDTNLDDLMKWSQQFGSVLSIQMMRLKTTHEFNGCAIIIFADKRMAETLTNQSALKFKDVELTKETKLTPNQQKRELKASKMVAKDNSLLVDQMKIVSLDSTAIQKGVADGMVGSVLQLKGMPRRLVAKEKKKKSNRIKEFFSGYGKVVYVSSDSSGNCLIQFSDRSTAQKVLDLNKNFVDKQVVHKLIFNGKEVTARLLSGDEEHAFWVRTKKRKEKKIRLKEKDSLKDKNNLRKRTNSALNSGHEPKRMTPATA